MTTRIRLAASIACAVLAATGVAACGEGAQDTNGSSSGTSTQAPPTPRDGQAPSSDRRAQLRDFTDCLASNGVDIPDRPPGQGAGPPFDPQDPDVQSAMEACRDELPTGFGSPRAPSQ